jgi:DeoR/GlpR family transcriptional regulator of sugar metabolism
MDGGGVLNARQRKVLAYINQNGSAQVRDLNLDYGVSEATIRRDFDDMARMGLIERVHGGAVRVSGTAFERVHSEKMSLMTSEKLAIAAFAATLVENGSSLFLDSGTTTHFLARELCRHKDLTIVTNNIDIAYSVQFDTSCSLIVTGGLRREQYSVLIGSLAEQSIENFRVDLAFMGCDAIDPQNGVYNTNFLELGVKQRIAQCGKTTVLVTDSSKFCRKALAKICGLSEIDMIITDKGLDEGIAQEIRKTIPDVVCV